MTSDERADEVIERILNSAPFLDYQNKRVEIRAKWLALVKQAINEAVLETETDRSKGSVYDIAMGALHALERADDQNYPLQLEVERLTKILACIEEGGEKYFTTYQDQVEHLQLLANRAHTPEESDATQTEDH